MVLTLLKQQCLSVDSKIKAVYDVACKLESKSELYWDIFYQIEEHGLEGPPCDDSSRGWKASVHHIDIRDIFNMDAYRNYLRNFDRNI